MSADFSYALHVRLRHLVIEAHATSWLNTFGVRYRKTQANRLCDSARLREACLLVGTIISPNGLGPAALRDFLVSELLREGVLVKIDTGHVVPWVERDRSRIAALPTRGDIREDKDLRGR